VECPHCEVYHLGRADYCRSCGRRMRRPGSAKDVWILIGFGAGLVLIAVFLSWPHF
jgi:hypothetical protein